MMFLQVEFLNKWKGRKFHEKQKVATVNVANEK